MNKKQKILFVDLINLLLNLPEDHKFHIGTWTTYPTEEENVECGTTCCAVGWGILMLDSWKEAGIYFSDNRSFLPTPSYRGMYLRSASVLKEALGITGSQFSYMFLQEGNYPDVGNISKEDVVDHIQEVLEQHGYEVTYSDY